MHKISNTTPKTIHKFCNNTIHPLCTKNYTQNFQHNKLIHIHQKEFQKLQTKFPTQKFIYIYTKSTKNLIFSGKLPNNKTPIDTKSIKKIMIRPIIRKLKSFVVSQNKN